MDAFFAADIAVSFFVAYFDRSANLFVDDRRKIATRYLKRPSFAMDVASTIPFNVIYQLVSGRSTGWFRYLNLLRLWRLQRVSKLFARLEKDIRFDYFYTRLIKLCGVTLLALHSSACIFLWMAFQVPPRRQGAHLARQPGARLRGRQRLGQLHLRRVLVHHHARHRRVRRPARREPRRDGVRHLLHALQHQPHLLHHRQHHQPRRPRRNQHIQDEGHGAAGLDVRERQPAAAGAEGADDGERAAQVQHSGGDPAAAAVRPAHGAPVPGRAPPLQGRGPALLPVSGSLQRPRRAAGFGDEGRVFPTPGGHHPPEGDHHRLLHHRLRLSADDGTEKLVMKIGPHGMAGEMGVILGVPQPFSVRSRRLTQALCISNSHLLGILRSNTADANTVCANFVKQLKSLKELQVAEDAPFFEETFSKTNMDELQIGSIFQQLLNDGDAARRIPRQNQKASFGTEQHEETAPCMLPRRQGGLRVVIHDRFPSDGAEKNRGLAAGKLILLPDSLQELMKVAEVKFGKAARRVLTVEGAEVDDVAVLRDGDHLVLCS
ncbi:Potassium channel KAT3 [Zea mays]|uniref:Potassium channel KAT3 n=1 Tax=Zea mays TaxID=4577 RepID=A0A1D6G3D3_MAIZE|nr:Potassium channel KAT3 [Zea mays]